LSDRLIPGRVENCTFEIVHSSWIWFLAGLATEDWCVEEDILDVLVLMIYDVDAVLLLENGDFDGFSDSVDWINDIADTGNDPYEILMTKILGHQLSHDT
jgi:hypothetical protein